MTTDDSQKLVVWAQETPNPYAIKFIVNSELKSTGKATFANQQEAQDLPLVHGIFDVMGVQQVYLSENTMTVTHEGVLTNEDLKSEVESIILTRYVLHDPKFEKQDADNKRSKPDRSHLSDQEREIEEILDRTIRPGLQADGGDIDIISFEDNELRILFQGACGGCPSALYGTLDAIQGILMNELDCPELRVIPI